MADKPKVVTIGGGTGHAAVLRAIKDLPIELTALVNMVDDGGSTGRLMRERGVRPMGDVRQALAAFSDEATQALQTRDANGDAAGNLLLADLEQKTGSFQKAIEAVREQFQIPYKVFPLTKNDPVLHARTIQGKEIVGQQKVSRTIIDQPEELYETVWIEPKDSPLTDEARQALQAADYIIITNGDLFGSVAPAFCVPELVALWPQLKAHTIWLPNPVSHIGHVQYKTTSSALAFFKSLNPAFHPKTIISHDGTFTSEEAKNLVSQGYLLPELDLDGPTEYLRAEDLLDHNYLPNPHPGDTVKRSPIAYDTLKLHNIFKEILV